MKINMVNKGVLAKNYYIDPEAVAALGADIERVMTEADQTMEEASEIIAGIASLTERVPAEIRCSELLDLCETAQAEIRSFDFLSYGKRVNQGLLNLIDHNQYITGNFIRKMRANTERAKRIGEEFRSLTDMITYSGGSAPMKGTAFSAVGNAEVKDTGSKEGNFWRRENREGTEQTTADTVGLDDVLLRAGAAEVLEINTEEVMIESGVIVLSNYMTDYGLGDELEINEFTEWISVRQPDLL